MKHTSEDLCERLFAISQEAFSSQHYNVAYHSLAAALEYAAVTENIEQLQRIEAETQRQLEAIDRNAPRYEHSTSSAKTRGHESIFALLARQARIKVRLLTPESRHPAQNS